MQPADACGKSRSDALSRADSTTGAFWEKYKVYMESFDSDCVNSPYKMVLERVIDGLEGTSLFSVMSS